MIHGEGGGFAPVNHTAGPKSGGKENTVIVITVNQKGLRRDGIEKLIKEQVRSKYPEASISVTKKDPTTSRSDRFNDAISLVSDARSEAEELKDELEGWKDNLPENLQDGDKAGQIDDAISSLEEFINACEEAESTSVDFPGMY